jgi:hypothetical protein
MGCMKAQADILKHLQKILIEIVECTEKLASSQAALLDSLVLQAAHSAYACHAHNMQVCAIIALCCVP